MIKEPKSKIPEYKLAPDGSFIIQNYNLAKPFANFFPGIAGRYGIPMWVFYVNRGQCIASFGVKDKDHPLLEFFPANRAWQNTPTQGFRTFIKIRTKKKDIFYEPFYNGYFNKNLFHRNAMTITPSDLTLKEICSSLGLETEINYFPIPNDCYAALARIVKIKNISRRKIRIQLLDGLPWIIPRGIRHRFLKDIGRTAEAWARVVNVANCAAFYKLEVDPTDRPDVIFIEKGNFYVSFSRPIIDPAAIFGPRLNFDYPYLFLRDKNYKYPKIQTAESKMPSAMSLAEIELKPGEEKYLNSLFGTIRSAELLKLRLTEIKSAKYLQAKRKQNQEIILRLQSDITTQSSSSEFDFYCRQTYLDNIIRGGYPIIFNSGAEKKQIFYLYMRKHGDLERDYNRFQIEPTYFSQGNGNFRDIAQNRRNDIWFNPDIESASLNTFLNLIQTDGFNPLIVKGLQYHLKDKAQFRKTCFGLINSQDIDKLLSFLEQPFTPGGAIFFIEENGLSLKVSKDKFLDALMADSLKEEDAQHKQEDDHGNGGFWTDHWTYCLDLLETYLELHPEKLQEILFREKDFKFYDNVYVVRPRKEKYAVYENKILQLDSIAFNEEKAKMQSLRPNQIHWTRTTGGNGAIYQTTLIAKLVCILVNKLASLDPFGCGIEMEANKPNWYDALNGLPALFGSSICETMELKRLIYFLQESLSRTDEQKILIFTELHDFITSLSQLLTSSSDAFSYWDKSYCLKEEYRKKTLLGIDGSEKELDRQAILDFLQQALKKVNAGIKMAFEASDNLFCAYFINRLAEYEIKDGVVYPRKFQQVKLPLFLEAQVHALKILKEESAAHKLYVAVKKSQLYDKQLKMYKVTGDLRAMPFEIGRCRAFSPGWLENESIWLHMEYKYLLEILTAGLYEEFYSEFKNILVCFQDPKRYGRSILENSSFIASSVFIDKNLVGTGFVARLSGSTAEFLHIWRIINIGHKPFFLNKRGELNLRFAPVLAGWLFRKDCTYSFNFLGSIKVIY
ncbi:MAG: hypothetical protein AMJ95_12740, partial [Omnitrophica WOR_2 bacterium SM23_72]